MTNHFSLLGLPENFDLDPAALEAAYFKAQQHCHPDRHVGKTAIDKQAALQRSVDINHAYRTLKDPLKRAQYLLSLNNIRVGGENDNVKPVRELLIEAMQWREEVAAADEIEKLDALALHFKPMIDKAIDAIGRYWQNDAFEEMAHETLRLNYLVKIEEEVVKLKQRLKKQAS